MYRRMGMGDAAADAAAAAASRPTGPLPTVSPYALVECGWNQKMVGSGPYTCQFDVATTLQNAWLLPGTYMAALIPGAGSLGVNTLSAIAWGGLAYLLLGQSGGGRRGR